MTPAEAVERIAAVLLAAGLKRADVRFSAKEADDTGLVEFLLRQPKAQWKPYGSRDHGWIGVEVGGVYFSVHEVPAEQAELARRRGAA